MFTPHVSWSSWISIVSVSLFTPPLKGFTPPPLKVPLAAFQTLRMWEGGLPARKSYRRRHRHHRHLHLHWSHHGHYHFCSHHHNQHQLTRGISIISIIVTTHSIMLIKWCNLSEIWFSVETVTVHLLMLKKKEISKETQLKKLVKELVGKRYKRKLDFWEEIRRRESITVKRWKVWSGHSRNMRNTNNMKYEKRREKKWVKLKSVKWPLEKYEKYWKYERGRFVEEKELDLFNKLKRRENRGK